MRRRLADEIIKDMRALAKSEDAEIAHGRADDLLVEGILSLARYADERIPPYFSGPDPVVKRAQRLVRAFKRVKKYYA